MPSTAQIKKFIRDVRIEHDRRIADSLGGGVSGAAILDSVASPVEGGFWRDLIDASPVLKLRHGDYEYNFNYDGLTYIGGASSTLVTTTPDTYVLGTDSVSSEGGLWYEVAETTPTLNLHSGNFNYSFNYDTITYRGDNSHLVSYLPFDASTTADACGNTWTASHSSIALSTDIKKFGLASLACPQNRNIAANNILDCSAEKWTADFWFYGTGACFNFGGITLGTGDGVYCYKTTSGYVYFFTGSLPAAQEQWNHFAFVKDGDNWYVFLNGTLLKSTTADASDLRLGNEFQLSAYGGTVYFDGVRFFSGQALWTENFTPPTAEDYL